MQFTAVILLVHVVGLQVPTSDYAAVVVTAVAEVPAVAWAAAVSKGFGGSTALVSSLVLGSACLLPSIISTALHAGAAHAAGSADTGWSSSLTGKQLAAHQLAMLVYAPFHAAGLDVATCLRA